MAEPLGGRPAIVREGERDHRAGDEEVEPIAASQGNRREGAVRIFGFCGKSLMVPIAGPVCHVKDREQWLVASP